MVFLCLGVLFVSLSYFGVTGRAVNITSAWFLPQEGFPVFYRYFSDKVTWNEAEAVCGFHHADLLSVQTSSQMDAARAYLKEIDVTDNIWIGLQKESPEKPFTWTNGEKLLGDGYWLEPIPKTNEKLCSAIDPASDFRWNSFYCRGPQVASFICELPVPEWAKKDDGCMITSLPSLTITLIPEMGVIQLFSDCGLDGTRRIACKGGVNRDEIIRRLSCDEEAFPSTIFGRSTTDTVKEMNTQASAGPGGSDNNRDETTQTIRVWETPQTRHRRETNVSSPLPSASSPVLEDAKPQTEVVKTQTEVAQVSSTQGRGDVLNVPSHVFPHSPYLASERNSPGKKTSAGAPRKEKNADRKEGTTNGEGGEAPVAAEPAVVSQLSTTTTASANESTTKPPVEAKAANLTGPGILLHPPVLDKGLPVLIITGEGSFNESGKALTTAAAATTSENPQIVFVIDDKEDFAEPYLVPLGDDVIINNPSLSPMEVIDVDLVEFDNATAKTTVNQLNSKPSDVAISSPTPPKAPEVVHPLKLGEKKIAKENQTTAILRTTFSNTAKPTTTPTVTVAVSPKPEVKEQQNVLEHEDKGDGVDIPQRPNRGRLLTHSNNPSFYPYFLNRVLG